MEDSGHEKGSVPMGNQGPEGCEPHQDVDSRSETFSVLETPMLEAEESIEEGGEGFEGTNPAVAPLDQHIDSSLLSSPMRAHGHANAPEFSASPGTRAGTSPVKVPAAGRVAQVLACFACLAVGPVVFSVPVRASLSLY
jgi:hypothetical protein